MAKKTIKDDFTLLAILLIPIAIAINFICVNLALALKLPLYLDSIGTYLVGMLAGPWVALVTGFLSITINAVSDPTLFPYALLAGLMGMVVGFFAKKGLFTSVPGMVFSGLVVALCSVVGCGHQIHIFRRLRHQRRVDLGGHHHCQRPAVLGWTVCSPDGGGIAGQIYLRAGSVFGDPRHVWQVSLQVYERKGIH